MADDFFQRTYGQSAPAPANRSRIPTTANMPVSTRGRRRRSRGANLLAGAVQSAPQPLNIEKPKDESNWFTDALDTPVIKGILDLLSTGVYSVGNYANYATKSDEQAAKDVGEVAKTGDMWATALEFLGDKSMGGAVGAGLLKGISAGIGGNDNDVKTMSDTVKNIQKSQNIDTESPESRNVQFWGGLAGDVALDPTTYMGLGLATAATKGAVRGATTFRGEKALAARTGEEITDTVAPSKWGNVKQEAKHEINRYRQHQYDVQQAKIVKKDMKKKGMDDDAKARYLVENLQTIRPAVARAVAKSMNEEPATAISKVIDDLSDEDLATLTNKLDESTPDPVPTDLIDTEDIVKPADPKAYKYDPQVVGLTSAKPVTTAERVVDELGQFRTTNRKPVYTPEQIANVNRMVVALEAKGTPLAKIKNSQFTDLGVRYSDVPLIKAGNKLEDIADPISVGDVRTITKHMADGTIKPEALAPFYDIFKTTDPKEISKLISAFVKEDSFKEAAKNINKYGTKRTGETPLPWIGVSGHGKLSVAGMGFTPADNLSAKTPANPEQSRKFLESRYNQSAIELAGHPRGPELRKLADDVFKETIDIQRTPAGPLRTRRGASTPKDLKGAKFETKYNTHSAMYRIDRVTTALRGMKFKNQNQYDAAWMVVLKDIDDRLRLAGFDPHLSNMAMQGDKLVVRLAPSDVFGLLKVEDRIRYIHGRKAFKEPIKEFLPTTILDLAEVLVRSATKLTPEGKIDVIALRNNALAALQGKYGSVVAGKREIQHNLDINTYNKNHEEILAVIDKEMGTTLQSTFKAAKTQPDKEAVIQLAQSQAPALYSKTATLRLDTLTNDLIVKFTKGMADRKPSILSALVNTNMRNASVFGGSVAKQIGEASAAYSERVLKALDSGSTADFLSELVTKPPFSVADSTAKKLLADNVDTVRLSVANADEVAHAQALNRGDSIGAYQKSPQLTEELNKAPKDMDTGVIYDLTMRELNKDILLRAFGGQRWFNKRAGMPRTFEVLESSSHAASLLLTGFHGIFRGFKAKGYTDVQMRVAMKAIQSTDGPLRDPVAMELREIMNMIFDPSKMNFLTRNTVGPDHFNKVLKKVDFNEMYRVPPNATPEQMNNVWRDWDITNVEDFLSKLMAAMIKTAEDVSMGASFSRHFGSPVPGKLNGKPLVKIVDPKGLNDFFPLIDNTLYYPKEIADEFVHIGRLMTESRSFQPGDKFYTFVTKVVDPIISTLKMTQTTMKPGHHVMSVTGDVWRNSLALSTIGMVDPRTITKLYWDSYQILRHSVGEIEELSELQKFARLQDITNEIKLTEQGKAPALFFGNISNGGKLSLKDLYKIEQTTGIALPAHLAGIAEDTLTDFNALGGMEKSGSRIVNAVQKTTSAVDRLANPLKAKLPGTKRPWSLNKFTANRDAWTRGALFLGAMRSRQFRNVDDAVEFASQFVKKWAPTATDLAAAEAKYARRMIFYYTWIRGMVPRIIESALIRPGIATIPNKGAYEAAQSNGIDVNSIGDPFPEGHLFPAWYTEKVIGPQYVSHDGDLWGMNPTGPLGDVMNSLGANVKPKDFLSVDAYTKTAGNFLNMSTPWFKAPIELIQGQTIEGKIPIPDRLQYLQDMIGPARTASRMTGKELYLAPGPDGLERPNRTESKFRSGMTDEELKAAQMHELLNWATGFGFTNYTSGEAINSAKFQQQAEKTAEKKKYERFQ